MSHIETVVEMLGVLHIHISSHYQIMVLLDIISFRVSAQSSQRILFPSVVNLEGLNGVLSCLPLFEFV